MDGDALLLRTRAEKPVAHLRSAGWKTHGADAKHVDQAGRLLTPFYAYVFDVGPGVPPSESCRGSQSELAEPHYNTPGRAGSGPSRRSPRP